MNSSDGHRVDIDRYRETELRASYPIARSEFLYLSPVLSSTLIALKDISRLRAVSSDHGCVAVDRYRRAEIAICRCISRGQFLYLSPVLSPPLIAPEDISRASVGVLAVSSDHGCVAVDRYRNTEPVICRRFARR